MSKKLVMSVLFIGIVLMLVMSGCRSGGSEDNDTVVLPTSGGVQRLHVEDCRLADEKGNPVQLTGMSSHGLLWYPEYINTGAMETLKAYGANTFRIAMYSDDVDGGYVQNREMSMNLAYIAIENALNTDMYAIVDWHVLRDSNPLTNLDHAVAFFQEISLHYGDCPNIIYEICNEPNGETTWDDIYAYANAVIPVIRNNAPNAIIIVGTPDYSYSVERVIDKPLEFDNVMYSFHFYAGQFDNYYNEMFDRCEKNDIPVFVSEWGINYGADGNPALDQAETFVTVLNRRGISWMGWALCNKDEVFSAIKPDCYKFSGWELDDLTDVGKLFFESFQ